MAFNVQHNSITYTSNLTIPLIANTGAVYITANGNNFVYDANGNFGLGITPSGWNSAYKTFEFGVSGNNYGAVWSSSNTDGGSSAYGQVGIGQNISAGTKYVGLGASSYYLQSGGRHEWYTSSYGSAGSNISFSQVMTLTSNGQLLLGSTSPVKSYSVLSITHLGGSQDAIDIMNTNQVGNGTALAMFNGSGTGIGSITMSQTGITVTSASSLLLGSNNTVAMTLDASGNLGLGVTPSAWTSATGLQIQNAAIEGRSSIPSYGTFSVNGYTQAGTWKYISSDYASRYTQYQGAHFWYSASSGTAGSSISFTQAMTLDNSGNFIVGGTSATNTASGRGNITLNGSSSAIISIGTGGSEKGYIYTQGTDLIINADSGALALSTGSSQPITFQTNATERARIDSSGNLGIGVTPSAWSSSDKAIQVGTNSCFYNQGSTYTMVSHNGYNSSGADIYLTTNYATRYYQGGGTHYWSVAPSGTAGNTISWTLAMMLDNNSNLTCAGNITAYGSLSDRKLKENIQPLTRGLNTLLKLNPVSFDWKKETKENEMVGITHDFGLIAQEVQEVIPELVRADREGTLSIRDRGLVSILIKAIQELKAEVDSLKEQIAVG